MGRGPGTKFCPGAVVALGGPDSSDTCTSGSLLQDDLDDIVNTWNHHLIRPSHNSRMPSGRPNVMYRLPALYGSRDYLCEVLPEEVEMCKLQCLFRELVPCDRDVYDMCNILMRENGHEFPKDPDSSVELYLELRRQINNLII